MMTNRCRLAKRRLRGLLAALGCCAALPATAVPEGLTTAEIGLWYGGPSYNRTVTGRNAMVGVSQAGAGVIGTNGAMARAAFVGPHGGSGPGLGLVPGQPGRVLVELGVQATLIQAHQITVSGNPGLDLLQPMWRDHASASARYRDQLSFSDASLPPGAPLTVSLSYHLSSAKCRGAGACELPEPPNHNPALAPFGRASAVLEMSSSVTLPGGVDRQAQLRVDSRPGPGLAGVVPGLGGGAFTHTFTVANGSTRDFELGLVGTVVFDGLDYVDSSGRALLGSVQTWFDLDYLGTLHIGAIRATDAQGRALPGFAITNSLGWTLDTTPPVPEPASGALLALGLAAIAWVARQRRRRLMLALACAAGTAQAQQLRVEGYACVGDCDTYVQQSAIAPLQDMALRATATATARSAAQAGYGVLRLSSASGGSVASSQASVGFSDWLTVQPALPLLAGEFGVLEWHMALDGAGDLQVFAANGYGSVSISAFAPRAQPGTGRSQSLWFNAIGAPVQFDGDALPHDVLVRQGFVFGEPFEIGFHINATTGAAGANALADLMHTATWGGVTAVRVAGAALGANDFQLQSASGTDYRGPITPVPELPPALLLLLGLAALRLRAGPLRSAA